MRMTPERARAHLLAARVARLATLTPDGDPHLVPITFAVVGDAVTFAVDHKPKTGRRLARLRNIDADPRVSVLADGYVEDWTRLWWARAQGLARVLGQGRRADELRDALVAKYRQYRAQPPAGPLVEIRVTRWSGWAAAAGAAADEGPDRRGDTADEGLDPRGDTAGEGPRDP